uniref:Uncharacterized protein n=1 Tax=Ditylenchus dipsaci TaxID=166011 RepID=A0A915D7T5_9BILA
MFHDAAGQEKLNIAVDGQYDSPGHCAELCSVACINNDTEMVLTVSAVHKIETGEQKKCNEELRSALPRIMNHLYYCASLPKEDPQVIKETALSSLLHLCGIHEWQKPKRCVAKCNTECSNFFSVLSDIVKLNGDSSTSYVESFNSIAIIYRPKRKF